MGLTEFLIGLQDRYLWISLNMSLFSEYRTNKIQDRSIVISKFYHLSVDKCCGKRKGERELEVRKDLF